LENCDEEFTDNFAGLRGFVFFGEFLFWSGGEKAMVAAEADADGADEPSRDRRRAGH